MSRVFFWWVLPYLHRFRDPQVSLEDLIEPEAEDQPQAVLASIDLHRGGLLRALLRSNGPILARALILAFVMIITGAMIPLAFRSFLERLIADGGPALLVGPVTTLGLALATQAICIHHLFFASLLTAQRVRVSVPLLIYRKLARLSYKSALEFPAGKVVNLVATDTNRISWFFNLSFSFMLHPLQVLVTVGILYHLLGAAGLYGSCSLMLTLLCLVFTSRHQAQLKKTALAIADQRVARTTEALNAIRLIKLYGWEQPQLDAIGELRRAEAKVLKRVALWDGVNAILFSCAPIIFSLVAISSMLMHGHPLSIIELLPALSALMTLRFALSAFPTSLQSLFDARVSCGRIEAFLNAEEESLVPFPAPAAGFAVIAANISSVWPDANPATYSTDISVRRGEIVAVVGQVGAGKTGLLLTLHGALPIASGNLAIDENRQYVPQVPWILSDTVRANILMGAACEPEWYERIIKACALDTDLERWTEGDLTVVGERGVNLSGGQRQRLALARAVYARPTLLLLDDPLSALDPNVAEKIFTELLRRTLKDVAILLVTHRHEFIARCDRGYEVTNGTSASLPPAAESARLAIPLHQVQAHRTQGKSPAAPQDQGKQSIIAEEERLFGAVQFATLHRYVTRLSARGWGPFLLGLVLLHAASGISFDLWIALLGRGLAAVSDQALGGMLLIGAISITLSFLRITLVMKRGLDLSSQYHDRLAKGVFGASLTFFSANPVGRIVNRFSRDLASLDDAVPHMLLDFVGCTLSATLIISILVASSPLILIVLIPMFGWYLWAQSVYRPATRECQRLDSVSRSPLLALVTETVAGLATLKHSRGFASLEWRMSECVRQQGKVFLNLTVCNRWIGLMIETAAALTVVIAFTIAVRAQQHTEIAIVGLGLMLLLTLSSTLNWVIRSGSMLEAGLTSAERIESFSDIEQEEPAVSNKLSHSLTDQFREWPARGSLEFEAAGFAYRPDLPCSIRHVDIAISPGEKIGVVGRTGAGKSTLLLGLFRIIEQREGSVKIDGRNLSSIPRKILRHKLGYIPQEPTILSGTLRINIDPFNEWTDAAVWQVLERVQLHAAVRALPSQLQFVVIDGGANLSHGQRQLICLARVLIRAPRIVVLDEATSSIDPSTDALIQQTLRTELKGATIITIAHRIETIMDYDRVVVIDSGTVVQIDTPLRILQNAARFSLETPVE